VIDAEGRVVHDVRYPHPVERVWRAISESSELAAWLMGNDFEPRVGCTFAFEAGPPRGQIAAEVVAVDAPTLLRMRWMLDGVATTVTITLRADGDGTVLHLEHAGLTDESRPTFDDGWVEKFDNLERLMREGA
jgi:uncharacterized protein YndB with AHSA1/START domain